MLSKDCFLVNCDGILSIKAARCWRSNSSPLVPPPLIHSEQTSLASKPHSTHSRTACNKLVSSNPSTAQERNEIQAARLSSHESNSSESSTESRTVSFSKKNNDSQNRTTKAICGSEKTSRLVRENSQDKVVKRDFFRKNMEQVVVGSMERRDSPSGFSKNLSRTRRKYTDTTPSQFCRVCQKFQADKMYVTCDNMQAGLCRKVVCKKCCVAFRWNWKKITVPGSRWCCPHCTNTCSKRAQCYIYEKTNDRRRLGIMKKRRTSRKER